MRFKTNSESALKWRVKDERQTDNILRPVGNGKEHNNKLAYAEP